MAQPDQTLSPESSDLLITKVTVYVKDYMSHYDGSHDYTHIRRVLALAHEISHLSSQQSQSQSQFQSPSPSPVYDPLTITLSALLHDVGDKKYLPPGQDSSTMVYTLLLSFSAPPALAQKIQTIVSAVSYSSEMRDPDAVQEVLRRFPELGPVQDADRLDAIGAVGVGRAFTYGGAVGERGRTGGVVGKDGLRRRGMEETIEHFTDKLERLEGMMKTEVGRGMARVRTERLKVFRGWWEEEQRAVMGVREV